MRNAFPNHPHRGRFGEDPRNSRAGGPGGFGGGPEGGRGGRSEGRGPGRHSGFFKRGPFEVEWSFDGRPHGGRAPGGPRGRGRLGADQLRLVLLKLIADEPRHGYDLIRAIEELTGGAYAPSAGMVYPTLSLLEEMGHIAAQSEGAKKIYAITDAGKADLDANAASVTEILSRLTALGQRQKEAERSPVKRAMHNLKGVLVNRLQLDDSGELAHEIAEILDETTRRIERL